MEFWKSLNEYKTKMGIVFFSKLEENVQWGVVRDFRERKSVFSLDFPPFGPSVFDGVRSKFDLRGEDYAWAPIWWSSDNSKR